MSYINYWNDISRYSLSDHLDHTKDAFTIRDNLVNVFDIFKNKLDNMEAEIMSSRAILHSQHMTQECLLKDITNENILLKKIITKMVEKDYPELMIEYPELFIQQKEINGL